MGGGERLVYRAADDARARDFRIANDAGFVDFLVAYAGRFKILIWNFDLSITASGRYLSTILRGVILIGEPPLCLRLNFQCIGLGTMGDSDQAGIHIFQIG